MSDLCIVCHQPSSITVWDSNSGTRCWACFSRSIASAVGQGLPVKPEVIGQAAEPDLCFDCGALLTGEFVAVRLEEGDIHRCYRCQVSHLAEQLRQARAAHEEAKAHLDAVTLERDQLLAKLEDALKKRTCGVCAVIEDFGKKD